MTSHAERTYDCPRCGRPQSAWYEGYCGMCEREHQLDLEERRAAEIEALQAEMRACTCLEGDCTACWRRHVRILALQGNESAALAALNR